MKVSKQFRFIQPLFKRQKLKLSVSHPNKIIRKQKSRISIFFLVILAFLLIIFRTSATELPPLKVHPLPTALLQWPDNQSGDYFSQIKQVPVGYLVWSQFPVKVYVQRPNVNEISSKSQQFQIWVEKVLQAIAEWSIYLPLILVDRPEIADIKIERSAPAFKPTFNRITRQFDLPRARSAQTRYELYVKKELDKPAILSHRYIIQLSPTQAGDYIQAAARHELGHALGIWGHSPLETDSMYFSQVRNPPPISVRDINTLKRIYQQPTRLG